jgi:hypothetical protein
VRDIFTGSSNVFRGVPTTSAKNKYSITRSVELINIRLILPVDLVPLGLFFAACANDLHGSQVSG